MNPLVSIRDVSKVYGSGDASVPALDGISLEVPAGEILLMMGPSGSGKTTLLSIMGCILRPTAGSVVICGRETSNLHERSLPKVRLSHIGFVFQGFNLFPTLSVLENVELALELKGTRGRAVKRIAGELLDRVGLSDKLAAFPANLSGGQKQRVAIARALAGDPEIVLADEPTAALDSTSGRLVMEMLQSLAHERGRAVVIVTHDNRTAHYADRVVRIEDGRLSEMTRTVARHDTFENRAETAHYF